MKKIIFTEEEINDIIKMYENKISTRVISLKFNIDRGVIQNVLRKNNITLRKPGRLFLGGVKESNKRYSSNPIVKERKKKIHANWSSQNREHLKVYHKKWRNKNVEQHRINKKNYERERKRKDPIYKLIANFRTAIWIVLKEQNIKKNGHYFDMLGYTQQDLINHLDKQLNNGMTWENYGDWHVDHKLPITSFRFKDIYDPEFKKCWSLENLQPMWGKENISKSNHILSILY